MRDPRLPAIYPITDRKLSGLSHADLAGRLIAAGARIIQLRDKDAEPRDVYRAAEAVLTVARSHGVPMIVNDRVDVAAAIGADGAHLGQDDLPPGEARKIMGEAAIIGYSTHSLLQAGQAAAMDVDYIAIGPVFSTSTKADPDPVVGIEGIRRAREVIGDKTLVAIGGINTANAGAVFDAGADVVAVIGGLLSPPDAVEERLREFLSIAEAHCVRHC